MLNVKLILMMVDDDNCGDGDIDIDGNIDGDGDGHGETNCRWDQMGRGSMEKYSIVWYSAGGAGQWSGRN